jgi:predicted 2-oxoglutarate/Fe(II)-dependent dioxygenase YbiX
MIENPLSYILIRPNVINPEGLQELVTHIKSSPAEDLSVFDPDKTNATGKTSWIVDKQTRDTQIVPMGPLYPKIEDLFRNTVKNIINPFYQVEVDSSEIPQVLSYGIGGHYRPHIDGESIWMTPRGEKIWKKSTDRDLSMVFFLNNDFEGGDFVFPELRVRVRPEPGMMVCFPSNHHYSHGVEPVTKGKRYSIVTWATVKGFPSMDEVNQQLSQEYGVPVI